MSRQKEHEVEHVLDITMKRIEPEALSQIVDYLTKEMKGKVMKAANGTSFTIEKIYIHNGDIIFEGYDYNRAKLFKLSYAVDVNGSFHEIKPPDNGVS
jgi:hypothetical protein